ncbi:NAD+ synthase [Fodinicurvata sp. EGI_FJ10296]|uniref:NAD+ synthase n=1 Tax=Fodinicurvata sp. EGI_FJ10296 TaxID=3231908 RepID=UPI003454FCCD
MTDRLAIALAQINPTVGDIDGNIERILNARAEAARQGADVVVTPELSVSGYPPEDLVMKPFFLDAIRSAVDKLAAATADGGPALIVGAPWRPDQHLVLPDEGDQRRIACNAAIVLDGGAITAVRAKVELPNYGVFDEQRVFLRGGMPGPVEIRGVRVGLPVCEDIWIPDVVECLEESGAELLISINGSPFERGKMDTRVSLVVTRVRETGLPLIYLNQVGGQDELVFDGASFVIDGDFTLKSQLPAFEAAVSVTQWARGKGGRWSCHSGQTVPPPEPLEAIYQAVVLGLRDYVGKNGFPGVVIGLSGGIDSAFSATIATDALGPDRVRCVLMPSRYTVSASNEDAAESARRLGVATDTIPIEPAVEAFTEMLAPIFGDRPADLTEENIQSRIRGLILMGVSNKLGPMVLSTGNKSEMSVGYATLYGDMNGGFNALKDLYKTTVFDLARWRNAHHRPGWLGPSGEVTPKRVIDKPPSAELRPDQKDEDSLPPYPILDDILACLIESEMGIEQIMARGHDRETVVRVWTLLDRAEYKRRQAPPGVKITSRSFGRDRRYPITNRLLSHVVK